jgi:hypothetical protein
MATSYAPWLQQQFDDLGDVLAGGKVETYEAGTSTPLASYQDLAGATPNANPVILDSAGRAEIRFTDGTAYKIIIKDSDDVTIDTKDNIVVGSAASAASETLLAHCTFEGTPGAQGFMGGTIFDRAVVFPIDFEGGQGSVQTNPDASYVISVRKNGVEVGTATIATDGTYTFATTSGVTVPYSSGDVMTFVAPASVGTAADFIITLSADVS